MGFWWRVLKNMLPTYGELKRRHVMMKVYVTCVGTMRDLYSMCWSIVAMLVFYGRRLRISLSSNSIDSIQKLGLETYWTLLSWQGTKHLCRSQLCGLSRETIINMPMKKFDYILEERWRSSRSRLLHWMRSFPGKNKPWDATWIRMNTDGLWEKYNDRLVWGW